MSIFAAMSNAEVKRAKDRAWLEACRCWQEYRETPNGDSNGSAAEVDLYRVKQMLHDAAWSAENYWRSLYDELLKRESDG
jgi:hypothetical protein